MATTNSARSPKRIRRWLQTTAAGTVLLSSTVFGLIAVQGANATAHDAAVAIPAATPWTWPSARAAVVLTPASATPAAASTPIAARTIVTATVPPTAGTAVAATTSAPSATPPATATPAVRARTRAS